LLSVWFDIIWFGSIWICLNWFVWWINAHNLKFVCVMGQCSLNV
jgi:hypothetical protein